MWINHLCFGKGVSQGDEVRDKNDTIITESNQAERKANPCAVETQLWPHHIILSVGTQPAPCSLAQHRHWQVSCASVCFSPQFFIEALGKRWLDQHSMKSYSDRPQWWQTTPVCRTWSRPPPLHPFASVVCLSPRSCSPGESLWILPSWRKMKMHLQGSLLWPLLPHLHRRMMMPQKPQQKQQLPLHSGLLQQRSQALWESSGEVWSC